MAASVWICCGNDNNIGLRKNNDLIERGGEGCVLWSLVI